MLGPELALHRKRLALSVRQLAEVIGIPQDRTIQQWESGENPVPEAVATAVLDLSRRVDESIKHWTEFINGVGGGHEKHYLIRYTSAEDYNRCYVDAEAVPYAHVLHNAALSRLQALYPDKVRVVNFHADSYASFLLMARKPDEPASRTQWAAFVSRLGGGAPRLEQSAPVPEESNPAQPITECDGDDLAWDSNPLHECLMELVDEVSTRARTVITLVTLPQAYLSDLEEPPLPDELANMAVQLGVIVCDEDSEWYIGNPEVFAHHPGDHPGDIDSTRPPEELASMDFEAEDLGSAEEELDLMYDELAEGALRGHQGAMLTALIYQKKGRGKRAQYTLVETRMYVVTMTIGFDSPQDVVNRSLTVGMVIEPVMATTLKAAKRRPGGAKAI